MTLQPMAKHLEHWPIDRLVPYAKNSRTHSDAQIAQIAASIREFGFNAPILVDSRAGIIAGHGRLLAARKLELPEVPVIVLDHLTELQKRAYILADNRLALDADWDEEMLRLELAALTEEDFDLSLTGFDEDELTRLLAEDSDLPMDEDTVPDTPQLAVTRPGDLWLFGNHRLLCGDARSMQDLNRLMSGALADMTFTDPPYNVSYEGKTSRKLRIQNDSLGDSFLEFLRDACANVLALTKGSVYMCMSSSELDVLQRAFREAGGHWSTFVIWAKNTFTLGRSDYQRQYEPILYGWREGTDRFWCGARDQGDVWFIDKPVRNDKHPIMKPVELVERAIRNSSKSRDIVLDPFAGSGSTVIACEKTGRSARLLELDPIYTDVIVKRWEEFMGKQAVLEADGNTFAQVEAERLRAAPES
jgi:DNA modification methylase